MASYSFNFDPITMLNVYLVDFFRSCCPYDRVYFISRGIISGAPSISWSAPGYNFESRYLIVILGKLRVCIESRDAAVAKC